MTPREWRTTNVRVMAPRSGCCIEGCSNQGDGWTFEVEGLGDGGRPGTLHLCDAHHRQISARLEQLIAEEPEDVGAES